MLSTKTKKIFAVTAFLVTFLVTRIPFLGYDTINPDAVNWHFRSEQFIVGLKTGEFIKTYQHYHPGVILMWVMGVPIEIYRQVNPQDRIYNEDNFITQHRLAKYSLVLVQLFLSLVLILSLAELIGFKKSILAGSIFSFEPWFLGNSRLLHMDVLLALFLILSLTYSYKFYLRGSVRHALVSGVFAGLAFLTKSLGLMAVLPAVILSLANKKQRAKLLGTLALSTTATIFLLFPALWVRPVFVLSDIYNEGMRVGTRRGHEQVVMGVETDVAGPGFYPLVLALKTSPLIWIGVVLFGYQIIMKRRDNQKILLYLTVFYLVYLIGISVVSKKIDRYVIPLFPWLGILAAFGFDRTIRVAKSQILLGLLATVAVVYPLIRFYPYYFTYTNPVLGTTEQANKIVGQKPFGVGIPELKTLITENYGENVPLGFIDRKPMSMIYQNSKLFDIRETGTGRYDLVILGPNEIMPEQVVAGEYKFSLDRTLYINGLAYWRIYKKLP
ncbi:MAG: glycosyltransferase family 39 protein [bacterium]